VGNQSQALLDHVRDRRRRKGFHESDLLRLYHVLSQKRLRSHFMVDSHLGYS
jgi:hypothetical protein